MSERIADGSSADGVHYGLGATVRDELVRRVRDRASDPACSALCEVGGGATPLISPDEGHRLGVSLTVADISRTELDLADPAYEKVELDVTGDIGALAGTQDLVVSQTLAEHLADPEAFHRNVFAMLRPGGYAIHLFPTVWAWPFALNRLMPDKASTLLVRTLQPLRSLETTEKKFPAYYRWCAGPTRKQLQRFEDLGYDVVGYGGYFGHAAYYRRWPAIEQISERLAERRLRHPNPHLTSFAIIELRRPTAD